MQSLDGAVVAGVVVDREIASLQLPLEPDIVVEEGLLGRFGDFVSGPHLPVVIDDRTGRRYVSSTTSTSTLAPGVKSGLRAGRSAVRQNLIPQADIGDRFRGRGAGVEHNAVREVVVNAPGSDRRRGLRAGVLRCDSDEQGGRHDGQKERAVTRQ